MLPLPAAPAPPSLPSCLPSVHPQFNPSTLPYPTNPPVPCHPWEILQDPLFLDLIGTCHSDNTKPVILKPQHLTWYRTHLVRGLTLYPPDILGIMLKEKKLERDRNGALKMSIEVPWIPWGPTESRMPFPVSSPLSSYLWTVLCSQSFVGTTVAAGDLHGALAVFFPERRAVTGVMAVGRHPYLSPCRTLRICQPRSTPIFPP